MATTVFSVFRDVKSANKAIDELKNTGIEANDISVIAKDEVREQIRGDVDTGNDVASSASAGAVTGGIAGALAGLLIGAGAIAVPPLGVVIAGPIATTLGLSSAAAGAVSGGAVGALSGGIIGALVELGVPEEDAKYFETEIQNRGIVLAVDTEGYNVNEIKNTLRMNGGERVSENRAA
jgi:uncharacterized membrane protein